MKPKDMHPYLHRRLPPSLMLLPLLLASCSANVSEGQAPAASADGRREVDVAVILKNMPVNSDERCLGIAGVAEALIEGKQFDRGGAERVEDLARRIYDNFATGRQLQFHPQVRIDNVTLPTDSRQALEQLSSRVAELYKQDHKRKAETEAGRGKLVAAATAFVTGPAELDQILDADADKIAVFCGVGVRAFPDGTFQDTDHVVLIRKTPGGKILVYDPNDPGAPIDCQIETSEDALEIEWTCRYRDTGAVTSQRYNIVHLNRFFRMAFGERRSD